MAALGLKPRRQIRQPLRGGVNEHGLQVLVETSEDESADKNEKHAKRRLNGMASLFLHDVLTAIAIGYRFKSPSAFPFEECSINSQCRCGFLSGELSGNIQNSSLVGPIGAIQ